MSSILVHVPYELKKQLEQHPNYRHGNCNDYYCSIFKRWTDSQEFQLDIANLRIKRLENQVDSLKTQVKQKEGTAEMFRKLWAASTQKAQPATADSAPQQSPESVQKSQDAA
jgi:hypothetical protein